MKMIDEERGLEERRGEGPFILVGTWNFTMEIQLN